MNEQYRLLIQPRTVKTWESAIFQLRVGLYYTPRLCWLEVRLMYRSCELRQWTMEVYPVTLATWRQPRVCVCLHIPSPRPGRRSLDEHMHYPAATHTDREIDWNTHNTAAARGACTHAARSMRPVRWEGGHERGARSVIEKSRSFLAARSSPAGRLAVDKLMPYTKWTVSRRRAMARMKECFSFAAAQFLPSSPHPSPSSQHPPQRQRSTNPIPKTSDPLSAAIPLLVRQV